MAVPTDPANSGTASLALLMVVYLTLNSSLNLANKWALGVYGFRFPFLLTSCHMAFSFLALAPLALRESWESHQRVLAKQWKGVVYIGAFMALNIALNNISLLDISLTLNQIIRSAIPVVTCMLAIVVEDKWPSRQELTALLTLTLGVMLAVWQGAVSGRPYAIAFCITGTVCNGAMMTFSGKLLKEKLDVVRLTFYTAPVSLACLLPFFVVHESAKFVEYFPSHSRGVIMIMGLTSINALAYNMVHSAMIKRTSAVTTTVLGEVKIVGLLLLSAMLLGESKEFTLKMTMGCFLAMLGFALYSHGKIVKFREQQMKAVSSGSADADDELQPLKNPASGVVHVRANGTV